MNFPVNPGLLIRECMYSNPQYDAVDTFANVANDCIHVCIYDVVLTHIPLHSANLVANRVASL